jgi:hypothetical protein
VGSNVTPPGGQGNQAGQFNPGQQATGGGNGAINGWDVATLRDLIGGSTKLPDMRTVPKIKDKDANTEGIIKYLKLQRYYLQAQYGRADPLTDKFFASKLPIGGRPGLDGRIARGTATPEEITAMRLNESAASCLLFGAADCAEVSDTLQDDWDTVEWPLRHVPHIKQSN